MTKAVILGDSPEILARDGLTDTIQPWEDGLRAPTGKGSFEWWYFDAHFDDPDTDPGTQNATAVIVFATKPLLERSGPLKPLLSITITRPDGSKIAGFPIFSPAEFNSSSDTCDVKIGDNWCKGDLHEYELQANGGWLDQLGWQPDQTVSLTNSFLLIHPPESLSSPKFFRARER